MKSHKPVQSPGVLPAAPAVEVAEAPRSNAALAETLFNRQGVGAETSSSRVRGDLDWLEGWLEEGPSDLGTVNEGQVRDSVSGSTQLGPVQASGRASGRVDENGPSGTASGRLQAEAGPFDASLSGGARASRRGVTGSGEATLGASHSGQTLGIDHRVAGSVAVDTDGKVKPKASAAASHSGTTAGIDHTLGGTVGLDAKGKPTAKASAKASVTQGTTTASLEADTSRTVRVSVGGKDDAELVEIERDLGHSQASVRALGAEAGARLGGSRGPDGTRLDASAEAALTLVEGRVDGEHEVARIGADAARVEGALTGAAEARATAKGSASASGDKAELAGELKLFAGAKAGAEIEGALTWDRKDYSELLADYADNIPGNLDDALLDKLPQAFWERASKILFGVGRTELIRGGVGVDARAGAGAEAKGKVAADGGLVSAEASAGAALGVGGGLKAKVGVNPLDLLRRAAVGGMHVVNDAFGLAEGALRRLRGVEKP
ncbi:MAG: hypothetical protein GY913_14665 [Proteobacteria bacterium]|nr:hypothetical protein [Pseudomonadota bacterium]MCP4918153.1 hypothetical protein [Pseudomonadota bacterium]